jgi:hypothetical protein
MSIDRNALASDLESLGLKALAGSVRNGQLTLDRVMRSVERTRDKRREAGNAEGAEAAQQVLNHWWGKARDR